MVILHHVRNFYAFFYVSLLEKKELLVPLKLKFSVKFACFFIDVLIFDLRFYDLFVIL